MGRGLGEGYWWGHGVRGIVEERGESTGGRGADKWKEKENTRTSLLSFLGPCVRKVMKSKLQHRTAKNKPLLFVRREH